MRVARKAGSTTAAQPARASAATAPARMAGSRGATPKSRPARSRDSACVAAIPSARQEGLIGLWQATVYLPLKKGRNELVLAVSDVFDGWGWMGQLVDAAGVKIEP
jgi:hypothetical protein